MLGQAAEASLASVALALLCAYVFLVAPGQAWWRGNASGTPLLLARVAGSALWTTLAGLALAALDSFALPRLAALSGAFALFGYLFVARVRVEGSARTAARGVASALIFVLALAAYWPPYETHIAASDSTTYTAAGIHLAHARHIWKHDPLVEKVPAIGRAALFFSVLGSPWKPPYARMPGGLVIDSPNSDIVRPAFFPVPIVWSALCADALGGRYAGAFAPLFAALGVWAFWHFARRRLSHPASLLATGLVALNAATYWSGRFPLAEPIAWFFLWSGLVALDAYEEDGFASDARLAGALLAAATVVRLELLPFLVVALMLRYLMRADLGSRPLTAGFAFCFAAIAAVALAQVRLLPGAYAAPITDTWSGFVFRTRAAWMAAPWAVGLGATLAALVAALSIRRFGFVRAFASGIVVAFVAAYVESCAQQAALRSLGWLVSYLGALGLVLALVGAALAWRERHATPGDGFFVVLAGLVTCALVYAPHVLAVMPWASRRFVPLVVPALLLWAVSAATRLRAHASAAGALVVLVLATTVLWPARALWQTPFYERSYDELRKVADALPKDGIVLMDNQLIPLLLSTPLWLVYDHNSLPVDTSTTLGRHLVGGLVQSMQSSGPLYLLKSSSASAEPIPFVVSRAVRDVEIELALPEQTSARPPQRIERYTQLISLFELHPWPAAAAP